MTKVLKAHVLKRKIDKVDSGYTISLDLDGYTSIEDKAALLFVEFEGEVNFNDLTDLSLELAKSIAKSQGSLYFRCLSKLTPELAYELSQHDGFIALDALIDIDDETAKAMASGPVYWKLLKLERLNDGPGSVALAKKLAKDDMLYALYSLKSVSKEVLSAVPEIKSQLE